MIIGVTAGSGFDINNFLLLLLVMPVLTISPYNGE